MITVQFFEIDILLASHLSTMQQSVS